MFRTGILLLFIFITGVQPVCQCFQDSAPYGRTVLVNNAFDTVTFENCYSTPCEFTSYSGNDALGWNYMEISWINIVDPTAVLTIYDGVDETAPVLATNKPASSPSQVTSSFQSSTANITVKYTQTSVKSSNVYYGTVQAIKALPTATPLIVK